MGSLNRQTIMRRIASVYDTAAGAQSTGKGIKEYIKELRKAAGLKGSVAGSRTAKDFLRDFGKGI